MFYLFLLILLNALFGGFLTLFIFHFIIKGLLIKQAEIKALILAEVEKSLGDGNMLTQKLEQLDLKMELGPFVEIRLEQVFQQMASQIPMGEILLAGTLGRKIKIMAQTEILNVLPELKEHFIKRINEEFDAKKLLEEKIQAYDFSHLISQIEIHTKNEKIKLAGLAALLGGLLGLLEGLLLL